MCACVPPPPRRIARRPPKTRVKQHWMGPSDTPTLSTRQNSKKTEILRQSFSFSYTRMRQCSPIGYMIGETIDIWKIINIGFSLIKIYVWRICNVQ